MRRELFVSKIMLTLLRYYVTLEAARSWQCPYIRNKKTVLFNDKWVDACLWTQNAGLVGLTLATLAADIVQINVVNQHLDGDKLNTHLLTPPRCQFTTLI